MTGLAVVASAPATGVTLPAADAACAVAPAPPSTPVLTNLAVSPATVDVRTGARSVVVTATAQDTVALTSISVSVRGGRTNLAVDLTRVAGTALDGSWSGTLVVPRWASNATYRITHVFLLDAGDHNASYTPSSAGWAAWTTSFAVTAVPDVTAPRLLALSTSTGSLNTTSKAKKLRVRAVLTDAQSGVGSVTVMVVRDMSKARFFVGQLTRSSAGSPVWVGTVRIPAWQGKGTHTWKLKVAATDKIGNSRTWTRADLAARGFRSTVRVTSRTDTTKPRIVSASFSPTSIDARTGAQQLAFTVRATDPQSGPTGLRIVLTKTGAPRIDGVTITGVTGDKHDRTYTGYVLVPQCGSSGAYTAAVEVVDAWGVEHPMAAGHVARTTRVITVQQLDAGP